MKGLSFYRLTVGLAAVMVALTSSAEPVRYVFDSSHTFPSFEADHFGGMSIWRGKINHTEGEAVLDREAGTGTIDVVMDMTTIDFGHERMNQEAYDKILHVAEFPKATYQGRMVDFENGAPTRVEGTLTIHGVSKPVELEITSFLCKPHWSTKIERCGAGATAMINRADFGLTRDLNLGFFPEVKLLIAVEGVRQED